MPLNPVCLLSNSSGQWLKPDGSYPSVLLGGWGVHMGPVRCVLTGRFLTRMELREKSWEKLTSSSFLLFFFQCFCISPRAGQSTSHPQRLTAGQKRALAPYSHTVTDPTSKHVGFLRIPPILVGRLWFLILEPGLSDLINWYSSYIRIEAVNWDKTTRH